MNFYEVEIDGLVMYLANLLTFLYYFLSILIFQWSLFKKKKKKKKKKKSLISVGILYYEIKYFNI